MSDSEETESRTDSLKHDRMSVSELEQDFSREDEMPSVEDTTDNETSHDSSISETQACQAVENASGDSGSADPPVPLHYQMSHEQESTTDLMTASYTEIETQRQRSCSESDNDDDSSLKKLLAEGTVEQEGNMIHFVAQDLENKIRFASPESPRRLPEFYRSLSQDSPLEPTLLSNIEKEAKKIASSVDELIENLAVSLHTISAISVESVSLYRDSVCKTCDSVDSNIKAMYQLMAKCEELSKATVPVHKIAEQVRDIKKLLDIFENVMS